MPVSGTHAQQGSHGTSRARGLWLGFAAVLAAAALGFDFLARTHVEGRWRDQVFGWLAAHYPVASALDQKVLVIEVGEEDLRSFGVPLALAHRPLGNFLEAAVAGRAAAVGLDIALPERSFDALMPGIDLALARGIVAARSKLPLVAGVVIRGDGQVQPLQPLFQSLLGPQRLAVLAVLPDADRVIRRFDERLGVKGERMPTLAGQLARALGATVGDGLMHYAHGSPIRTLPLRQVLAWHAVADEASLRAALEGRYLLLGIRLPFEDQHRTPVALHANADFTGSSDGVLVHAQQLRNLLEGRLVRELDPVWAWLGVGLLALLWWVSPGVLVWLGFAVAGCGVLLVSALALREGLALPVVGWLLCAGVALGGRTLREAWVSLRERDRLRANFSGLVSPAVLEEILSGRIDPQSSGVRRDICVLFSDIRGFTSLSENLAPERVTALLNRYFGQMAEAVHRHGGTLDKFIGDGIMAVFGAPEPLEHPCDRALASAIDMLRALEDFNAQQRQAGEPEIRIGVGLHFGPAIVGYVGSAERFEYSAIGDTVNTASRIESLTKELGRELLMSAAVVQRLRSPQNMEFLGRVPIRGRGDLELYARPHAASGPAATAPAASAQAQS